MFVILGILGREKNEWNVFFVVKEFTSIVGDNPSASLKWNKLSHKRH
jgi:hypothetical protein